jgi:hypothetical protein
LISSASAGSLPQRDIPKEFNRMPQVFLEFTPVLLPACSVVASMWSPRPFRGHLITKGPKAMDEFLGNGLARIQRPTHDKVRNLACTCGGSGFGNGSHTRLKQVPKVIGHL